MSGFVSLQLTQIVESGYDRAFVSASDSGRGRCGRVD